MKSISVPVTAEMLAKLQDGQECSQQIDNARITLHPTFGPLTKGAPPKPQTVKPGTIETGGAKETKAKK